MHRLLPVIVVVLLVASACAARSIGPSTIARSSGEAAASTDAVDEASRRVAYGDQRDQFLDLRVPAGDGPFPVLVLLHGGYWLEAYRSDLMDRLASDAVTRGFATANVEYRRVGGAGGWPETFEDVAAAVDHLAGLDPRLDLTRVALVGHSAGGHLALWAAARGQLPAGSPGANPLVVPCAVVGQAPVANLAEGAALQLGGGAVQGLLGGGPEAVEERYALADPAQLLPLGVPTLIVHGRQDDIVPPWLSEDFVALAEASGDATSLAVVEGDHFVVLDPGAAPWARTLDWLTTNC